MRDYSLFVDYNYNIYKLYVKNKIYKCCKQHTERMFFLQIFAPPAHCFTLIVLRPHGVLFSPYYYLKHVCRVKYSDLNPEWDGNFSG